MDLNPKERQGTLLTGFWAGLNASCSPSSLTQLEWTPEPSCIVHGLCLAELMGSAGLASKDIFFQVSLCGGLEPTLKPALS